MIPNLLTAINFKNTIYCILRYLQDFPHNIPQKKHQQHAWTTTTQWSCKPSTLNMFSASSFHHSSELCFLPCLHCARTVELLERKAISEKRPRQILNFHCWNPWNINSSTQTTEKNPQKVNLMPIISRSNKWQVCRIPSIQWMAG